MISLIPCYSLEDFSLYRQSSEVDEIFSAWSALYHPALVAHFNEAPHWEAAGSPSTGKKRHLVVIPPCAEYLVSHSWIKSAETDGAVVIRHTPDRDDILKVAFDKLGISRYPEGISSEDRSEYDNAADSFLSVGLNCLLEELLTRKLRYMSNLDQVSFNTRIVEAATAFMTKNAEEREKNLQKAFDLLTTSKEYFFPTATKLLDLTWVQEDDLAEALPNALKDRKNRNENTNLVLTAPLLRKCAREYPALIALLKEEIEAKRVTLIGSDKWEAPLYLMSPIEIAQELLAGRNDYSRLLGTTPTVFGRQEAGYAQILPQILKQTEYQGVLARTGDGWSLLEKPSDRSQIRWQGRDGSIITAFCKKSLDATSSEDLIQLPDRIGNSYYTDDGGAILFEHRPGNESRWLHDIMRMSHYSPVLGKFYNIDEYFLISEGTGPKEKFVKDRFRTNFLTRSVKRGREDVVSLWVKRQRLGTITAVLDNLETTIRILTLKVKKTDHLNRLFDEYINLSNDLKKKTLDTLTQLNEYLLPVEETSESLPFDIDKRFDQLEEVEKQINTAAGKYLTEALSSSENADCNRSLGYLFVNTKSTPTEILWEVRSLLGETDPNLFNPNFAQAQHIDTRIFSSKTSKIVQFVAKLPPGIVFWLPKIENYEYNFITRPLFDNANKTPRPFENKVITVSDEEISQNFAKQQKNSFFKKVTSILLGDAPNLAQAATNTDERTNRLLAEYVFKRYSATEVEKYYRLKNDIFELRIDPVTGTVKRLTTFETNTRFNNGVLRQPSMGNRLAWDFAFKLTDDLLREDRRPKEDSCYGYTVSAADSIEILSAEPGVGRIKTSGRMMAPNGEIAGKFTQIITIRLKSSIIDVDVKLEPNLKPGAKPWDSYFGCRFAWKDSFAEIRGGVGTSLIGTARDYIQAPESVDIHSDDNVGITILSCGLPYYRKISDTRMDAILIPQGETKKHFHFAIGVDLTDPHTAALDKLFPAPITLDSVPCPKRVSTSFFSADAYNVHILSIKPILGAPSSSLTGVKMTLLETHSVKTKSTIHSFLPIERVESFDLVGTIKKETIELTNANSIDLEFAPRELKTLEIYFKDASLK